MVGDGDGEGDGLVVDVGGASRARRVEQMMTT